MRDRWVTFFFLRGVSHMQYEYLRAYNNCTFCIIISYFMFLDSFYIGPVIIIIYKIYFHSKKQFDIF